MKKIEPFQTSLKNNNNNNNSHKNDKKNTVILESIQEVNSPPVTRRNSLHKEEDKGDVGAGSSSTLGGDSSVVGSNNGHNSLASSLDLEDMMTSIMNRDGNENANDIDGVLDDNSTLNQTKQYLKSKEFETIDTSKVTNGDRSPSTTLTSIYGSPLLSRVGGESGGPSGGCSSPISRLRKGSLPTTSLYSYREQKQKNTKELGLSKKEMALQQRNARHFWGTMLIPGLDILKSDLVQVKQESDSRLLLYITDIKRQIRSMDLLDAETQQKQSQDRALFNELLTIANSFLSQKPNQIECCRYAEDLLKRLNSPDIQGKTRDKVINLLFIISNFGRIKEFLAIETEEQTPSSPLYINRVDKNTKAMLDLKGLLNYATPPPSPPQPPQTLQPAPQPQPSSTSSSPTTSILTPPPLSYQHQFKQPPIPNNPLINQQQQLNLPNQFTFNRGHFRNLSYSPKYQSPPNQSDDESDLIPSINDNNNNNIVNIGKPNENDALVSTYKRSSLHPSPLSRSFLPNTQQTIQPPLLSRKQIENNNNNITSLKPPIVNNRFQPTTGKSILEDQDINTDIIEEIDLSSSESESESEDESDDEVEAITSQTRYYSPNEGKEEASAGMTKLPTNISPPKISPPKVMVPPIKVPSTSILKDPRLDSIKSIDPVSKRPLIRSKSFGPKGRNHITKKKMTRSFSEIPSIKVLETNGQQQMALCRICEEKINSSLLEEHSKICALANQQDMNAISFEDNLRAIAKVLLVRSTNLPTDKRKQISEFREIAQQAVELGLRDCFKLVVILKEKMKKVELPDDNYSLYKKIEFFINEKINALRKAEEVINSSPRIFRTNSPRVLISPRSNTDCTMEFKLTGGRSRSDSDPTSSFNNFNNSNHSSNNSSQNQNDVTNNNLNNLNTFNQLSQNQNRPKGVPTIDDFQIIKPITKGGFGKVYLAKKKTTGDIYAIKRLKKSDMVKKNQVDHVKIERNILARTSNPYVVKMYYSFQSRDYFYLVMEYVHGGDCFSLLQNLGALDEDMAKMIIAETVLALEYLHGVNIIHRDLKPDNLLIDKNGHIKLTDFGLSKVGLLDRQTIVPTNYFHSPKSHGHTGGGISLSQTKKYPTYMSSPSLTSFSYLTNPVGVMDNLSIAADHHPSSQPQPISNISPPVFNYKKSIEHQLKQQQQQFTKISKPTNNPQQPNQPQHQISRKLSCVGTPDYLAPEILLGIGHGKAVDWFAVGVILFEFLNGLPPFSSDTVDGTFQNILQRNIKWPEDISPEAKDLIDKLLALNPQSRLGFNGAEEVKSHPFFNGINWNTIRTQKPFFVPVLEDLQDTSYFDARKQFYDLRVSDDHVNNNSAISPSTNSSKSTTSPSSLSLSSNTNISTPTLSSLNASTSNLATSSLLNSSLSSSGDQRMVVEDDFLYVNFQSLSELNHNYLVETNPYVISRRRNSL